MNLAVEPRLPANLVTRHQTVTDVIHTLDSWGFDVGSARLSVWTVVVALVVIAGLILFARFASRFVGRMLGRVSRLDPVQRTLAEKMSGIAIWAVAFFIGIDLLGINLTALTVFSGAFGLAIGFGLQKTFGNMIAGIILLLDRSIKPGDVIAVNDGTNSVVGQVSRIGFRAVSVITRDKKEFLIPNENLMVNQVENWSFSSRDVRIRVPIGIGYGSDTVLAERLMIECALATGRVLPNPRPVVLMTGFGDNALEFEVRLWVDDPEEGVGNVRSDLLKRVLVAFRENGVALPFPQRDIYLKEWPALRRQPDAES